MFMFSGCISLNISSATAPECPYEFTIPTTGTFTEAYTQMMAFTNCAGTRLDDNISCESGKSCTYFTQNPPIG